MQTCAPVPQLEAMMTEIEHLGIRLLADIGKPFSERREFGPALARCLQVLQDLRPLVARQERDHRATREDASAAAHKATRRLRHLRQCSREMVRLADVLVRIGAGEDLPLYPPALSRHDLYGTQLLMLDQTLLALHRLINPAGQSPQAAELGCFPDIALRASSFVSHAHAAYRVALAQGKSTGLRFLDVGCGGGMKVLSAADFFGTAEGLDYDPAYVSAANTLFAAVGTGRCRAYEANGLTFTGYDAYDVIYFYRPMKEHAGLAALEEQIVRHARPGTILIAPYSSFAQRAADLDFAPIEGEVYVAGMAADAAKALCRAARFIGPDVPRQIGYAGPPVDWLRDLWLACARQGYVAE